MPLDDPRQKVPSVKSPYKQSGADPRRIVYGETFGFDLRELKPGTQFFSIVIFCIVLKKI